MAKCPDCAAKFTTAIPLRSQRTLEISLSEKDGTLYHFYFTATDSHDNEVFTKIFIHEIFDQHSDRFDDIIIRTHPTVKPTSPDFWKFCAHFALP